MECKACALACGGKLNASEGWGNPEAKLVIYLEAPGSYLAEKLLIWILYKLSLTSDDVWIDYMVKCPTRKEDKKKQLKEYVEICWRKHPRNFDIQNIIILSGNNTSDLLGNLKMKDWHGRKDPETGNWCIYSFNYLLLNPSECVDTYRVIYKAAEEAGLSPKMNMKVEVFKFPSKKIK